MKALSLRPEWAMPVLLCQKTVECRTWKTDYRGRLLICASARKCPATIAGKALCTVELIDVVPFGPEHLEDALLYPEDVPDGAWAWIIGNVEWIEPFDVKGKLHLFDVDDGLIRVIPPEVDDGEALRRFYEPHIWWGRDKAGARAIWREAAGL